LRRWQIPGAGPGGAAHPHPGAVPDAARGHRVPNMRWAGGAARGVESEVFTRNKSPLRFALGKDVAGHPRPPTWNRCRTC